MAKIPVPPAPVPAPAAHGHAAPGGHGHAAPPPAGGHTNWGMRFLQVLSGLLPIGALIGSYATMGGQEAVLNAILAGFVVVALWVLYAAPSQAYKFSFIEFGVAALLLGVGYLVGASPTAGDMGRKAWVQVFKGVDRMPKPEVGIGKDCTFEAKILKPTPELLAKGLDLMAAPEGSAEGDVVPASGLELKVPTRVFVRDRATGSRSSTITLTP